MGVIPIFVKRTMDGGPVKIFGDGKQTRDFLNVQDVVSANLLAYASDGVAGEVMNVGGPGKEVSILSLAGLVMELCGFRSEPIFEAEKPGDIRRLVANNSKAERLIGYRPSISLEQGLDNYVRYVRSSIPVANRATDVSR
jgi:UDP-glucose 4-epimerase